MVGLLQSNRLPCQMSSADHGSRCLIRSHFKSDVGLTAYVCLSLCFSPGCTSCANLRRQMVTHNALQPGLLGKGHVVQHFIPGIPFTPQ